MNPELSWRATAHAALGDPVRLSVVDALLLGDRSPGALGAQLGIPSNLLAHHVGVLESAELVTRVRSEGDRRRVYLRLDRAVLAGLVPAPQLSAPRVVFVCTHNSARSQLAAALWRQHSPLPVASGGTHPARRVHPRALATAQRHALRLGRARPQLVDDVLAGDDLVVTVCDAAQEELASALGGHPAPTLHWSVPDPARPDTDEAFEAAYATVASRVRTLAAAVVPPSPA